MEITQDQFNDYLQVQASGICNMFDIRAVEFHSMLDREQIKYIHRNYDTLCKAYPESVTAYQDTEADDDDGINAEDSY
jgi:hypothetical protein